jgi:hypothetical protein
MTQTIEQIQRKQDAFIKGIDISAMVERWDRWEARDVVALADRYQDDAPRLLPYTP